ncbi:MAG: hypothetical protein RLZZ163_1200, partial [Actinomycetota bacterium]
MTWLTGLSTFWLLLLSLMIVGVLSFVTYWFLHVWIGDHREHAGVAAAAYMTALGSLFAILTGFLINSEYTTLRSAQSVVGQEASAASRLAWATEGLPSVDVSNVQSRLGTYLELSAAFDWKAFADGTPQSSPAFRALQELQGAVFAVASREYVSASTGSAMESAVADMTTARRELISTAAGEMPWQLFALSVLAGLALIINALFVALRTGGNTVYVAIGIIAIVALDLALVLGISAPFRGPFVASRSPVETMAIEINQGLYLPWIGPGSTITTDEASCRADRRGCLTIGADESIQLGELLRIGADSSGFGLDARRGAELAIDYLDTEFDGVPGTLLGHRIEVVAADDGCSAEGGRTGAAEILGSPRVVAMLGTSCSGAALDAAVPVVSAAGVPLMSAQNTAPGLTATVDPERTYSRTAPNDLIQGSVVAEFVHGTVRSSNVVVVSDGTVYSEQLGEVFSTRLAALGTNVSTALDAPDGTDMRVVAAAIIGSGADVVYMPVNAPVCSDLMDAIAASEGYSSDRLTVITSDGCALAEIVPSATRVGALVSSPDITALDRTPFYADEYGPAYRDSFGEAPLSVWNASAFDATNLLFDAIQRIAVRHADGS